MPVSVQIGDVLVDYDELDERRSQIREAIEARNAYIPKTSSQDTLPLAFSKGTVDLMRIFEGGAEGTADTLTETGELKPTIEFGKPLHIEIITVYNGVVSSRKRDLLVASAVKKTGDYEAMPKAVNQIFSKAADKQNLRPGVFNPGSPTVFYSPALEESTLQIGFHIDDDSFDNSIFNTISDLLSFAGGIPIFAPASMILMAGSRIVKMLGGLGNALLETQPFFAGNFNIRFNDEWYRAPHTGLHVLWPDTLAAATRQSLDTRYHVKASNNGQNIYLAERAPTGKPYDGDVPYLIFNFNTKGRPELKDFKPQHASAALLEKFYGTESPVEAVVTEFKNGVSLYNDLKYHDKALAARRNLKRLEANPEENAEEIKRLQTLIEAYEKNISDEAIRELVAMRLKNE